MAKRITNLELRGRCFYYRVSFTLNRKTFGLRLSLETADPVVARERAARMDLTLKRRWREVVASPIPMTEDDKRSVMRAAAIEARRGIEQIEAAHLATPYEQPDEGLYDLRRSLRSLQLVVRDVVVHGLHRDFGSREYEMHLLGGVEPVGPDELSRIRETIEGGDALVAGFRDSAAEALRRRNVDATPVNVAAAAREIARGTLLALREAMARTNDPSGALDEMLGRLEMPAHSESPDPVPGPLAAASEPSLLPDGFQVAATGRPDSAAAPAAPDAPQQTGFAALNIHEAADAFLAAHPRYDDDATDAAWTPKTRSQFEAAIFLSRKFFGDVAIGSLGELELANLVRTLRRLPANHHKTPAHACLSLQEIAERGNGVTLGIVTVNRHVRFIRLVLDWAWKRTPTPPQVEWSSFIGTDKRLKRDKRPAFTSAELEKLFSAAIWHGSDSKVRRLRPGPHVIRDAAYWVPVLLAYTGARREEMAKLATADVEEVDGVWCVRIRINEGGRLKNEASKRDVPIADAILELDFLAFVEGQRQGGSTLLFPELRRTAGSMGDVFYKKWWRALERAGLVPEGKDIHSIRHYVSTTLANLDVSEERRADLLGHTLTSETAGTYTKRTALPLLRQVVNLLPRVTAGVAKQDRSR